MLLYDSPVSGNCYKVRLLCAHRLAYSGRPEAFAERLEERTAAGHRALAAMERHLDGREYLVGAGLTLADLALYAYTHVAHEGGFDIRNRRVTGRVR